MGKKKVKKAKTLKSPNVNSSSPISDAMNSEIIAAALGSVNLSVLMKVCRLCETKDGPFLNIFDADRVTSKKIEEMLPFGIQEDDGLPHKICFRCSAKVEELHEFIQKCINTQKNLHTKLGKKELTTAKPKARELWEAKLNISNISNDDLCDAVIKKAMENIKDIANIPALMDDDKLQIKKCNTFDVTANNTSKKGLKQPINVKTEEINSDSSVNEGLPVSNLSKSNLSKPKNIPSRKPTNAPLESSSDQEELPLRPTRKATRKVIVESDSETEIESTKNSSTKTKQMDKQKEQTSNINTKEESPLKNDKNQRIDELSFDYVEEKPIEKPFNIMDHISMIKVNNVGVLFQCKLCNRNFLKKEVVEAHGCAKNGVPKVDFTHTIAKPDPPKITTVKYINTKVDGNLKKSNVSQKMPAVSKTDIEVKKEPEEIKVTPKPKPKIGPASRVRRNSTKQIDPKVGMVVTPQESSVPPPTKQAKTAAQESATSIQIPSLPSLNSRYKLVPGPNNTFCLVEDKNQEIPATSASTVDDGPSNRKRKLSDSAKTASNKKKISSGDDIIDIDDLSTGQPYPVGLFQTVPPNAKSIPEASSAALPSPAPFTTPAMKKQSYTIVKTSNPSKILISTKPQVDETTKKRSRKPKKLETKEDSEQKQPFSVTLEDKDQPKDQGFFTFINVDPLLQPSFVLPVDSIIQESQITTSSSAVKKKADATDKINPYTCNMCAETFNREKKLLAHIQSHYNKIDIEDQVRAEKTRKQSKKS